MNVHMLIPKTRSSRFSVLLALLLLTSISLLPTACAVKPGLIFPARPSPGLAARSR